MGLKAGKNKEEKKMNTPHYEVPKMDEKKVTMSLQQLKIICECAFAEGMNTDDYSDMWEESDALSYVRDLFEKMDVRSKDEMEL